MLSILPILREGGVYTRFPTRYEKGFSGVAGGESPATYRRYNLLFFKRLGYMSLAFSLFIMVQIAYFLRLRVEKKRACVDIVVKK